MTEEDVVMKNTSRLAGQSIEGVKDAMYAQILGALLHASLTCDEVEERLNMRHQTASARICELHKNGDIVRSGITRPTRSGRAAHVYVIDKHGQARLAMLEQANEQPLLPAE